MQFLLLVYVDPDLMQALPEGKADAMMRECLGHADAMKREGSILDFQQLEDAPTARTVRSRGGRVSVTDGPFAEAREVLGGFNLIEAENMDEAVRMAMEFPWTVTGSIEVRPVRDIGAVRRRVNVPAPTD